MKAILFDLDGTLLDIDMNAFLPRYFDALGPVIADIAGVSAQIGLAAVLSGTEAMFEPHPGRTNQEVFATVFAQELGGDIGAAGWKRIKAFYREAFPALREGLGPHVGAREVLLAALARGMKIAIATNPIFPRSAIEERLRWADLGDFRFDLITSYETMHACKPLPAYFIEAAEMLETAPEECLMVGDDPGLDMPASRVGMRTYFVGQRSDITGDWTGNLTSLTRLLAGVSID